MQIRLASVSGPIKIWRVMTERELERGSWGLEAEGVQRHSAVTVLFLTPLSPSFPWLGISSSMSLKMIQCLSGSLVQEYFSVMEEF